MICYICKKEFQSLEGELICHECDEAAFLCNAMSASFQEWQKTLVLENKFWKGSKIFVKGLINKEDKNLGIAEQADNILISIKKQIIEHLKYYNKDEAIVALLTVKEATRRLVIKRNNSKDFSWGILNDYDIAIKLIEFIINIPKEKFLGAPIGHLENGYSNFISAICLGRIYVILNENCKNIRFLDIKAKNLDEIAFDFIETDDLKKYFDEYLMMGLDDKPEDYKIESEHLRNKIHQEEKTPSQRRNSVNSFTEKEFGFNLDSLELFSNIILFEEFSDKEEFLDYCTDKKIFNEYVPQLAIFNKSALKEALQKKVWRRYFS